MKSVNRVCMIFLFLLIGLFSGLQASAEAFDSIDLSNCQLIKISSEQILMSDEGIRIVDLETQGLLDVDGFICLENDMYAIQRVSNIFPKRTACGHAHGCFKCSGCVSPNCWNYCPGCR